MKIVELHIIDFGGLTDRKYTLDGGLNIFQGDNESGKSTVWLFIKFMLFGMPKKGHPDREKSISRSTHRAGGIMTVIYDGQRYRIERSFSEGSRGRVTVYNETTGEKAFTDAEPGEAMLGVTRDVFENSCGIGQSACSGLGGEKGAAAIRNILSSADESVDIDKIKRKLDGIRVYYRHLKGNGGRLYELSTAINETEQRLERATESRLRIATAEERLEKNSQLISAAEARRGELRELLADMQKAELIRRFDALYENERAYTDLEEERSKLLSSSLENEYLPTAADVANLSMLADSMERAEGAFGATCEKLQELESEAPYDKEKAEIGETLSVKGGADAVVNSIKKAGGTKKLGVVLCALGAIGIGVGITLLAIVGMIAGIVSLSAGAVLGSAGAATIAVSASRVNKISKEYGVKGTTLCDYIRECERAAESKMGYNSRLSDARADKKSAAEHSAFISSELERAIRRTSSTSEISSAGAREEAKRLKVFIDGYSALTAKIDRLSAVIANDRQLLSVYNDKELRAAVKNTVVELSDKKIRDTENEERFYSEKLRTLTDRDRALRTDLINLKATDEDPAAIADKLSDLRAEYTEAEEYYESLVIAIEGIEKAAASMRGNITPLLGDNAGKMMEYISDGRYKAVSMGPSLDVALVDKDGLTTSEEMMSGGTEDAAYLAVRISLMMQIYGGELPPLMMDETLCQLDDTRMKRILKLVGKLCEESLQCILFTCHRREASAVREMSINAKVFDM